DDVAHDAVTGEVQVGEEKRIRLVLDHGGWDRLTLGSNHLDFGVAVVENLGALASELTPPSYVAGIVRAGEPPGDRRLGGPVNQRQVSLGVAYLGAADVPGELVVRVLDQIDSLDDQGLMAEVFAASVLFRQVRVRCQPRIRAVPQVAQAEALDGLSILVHTVVDVIYGQLLLGDHRVSLDRTHMPLGMGSTSSRRRRRRPISVATPGGCLVASEMRCKSERA